MNTRDIFGVYPFQVGSQEAWALHDGFVWGEPVQQYAVGVPKTEIVALFESHFLNPQRIQLGMSPILFRWGGELVLVDAGIGSSLRIRPDFSGSESALSGSSRTKLARYCSAICMLITLVGYWTERTRNQSSLEPGSLFRKGKLISGEGQIRTSASSRRYLRS